MVSFDVESLFTNISLRECIDLAVDYITKGNLGIKLSTSDLKRLFLFATAETHFIFKGTHYDQIDGVAMGSPLAPVLSLLIFSWVTTRRIWLEQYRDSQVLYYRRYVDDTFCLVLNSERDADLSFNFINNQHPNIHFTMERESNQVLPFLDVTTNPHNSLSPPYTAKRPSRACLQYF